MLMGKEDIGYGFGKDKQTINHLFFMVDLKLHAWKFRDEVWIG